MRKALAIGFFVLLLIMPVFAQGPVNLLSNPSLDAPYTERKDRVTIAHGWEWSYWDRYLPLASDGGSTTPIIQPEYKQLTPAIDPMRVIDGDSAQGWFWAFAVGDATVYQTVPVTPGKCYQAGAWASSWVSNQEDTHVDGEMYFNIGLSPEGRTIAWETGIIWTPFQWSGWEYREIKSRVVRATGSSMTVFLRAASKWKMRHNDAYFDKAWMYEVSCGGDDPIPTRIPTPTPTPTPPPPTGDCLDAVQTETIFRRVLIDVLTRIGITISGG